MLENNNTSDVGFRFREPLPYLLVTAPVDVERDPGDKLYTYNVGLGFLPLCDADLGKSEGAQQRLECAKAMQELKSKFQKLSQAKPAVTPQSEPSQHDPIKSSWMPPVPAPQPILLVSQLMAASRATKPKDPKKDKPKPAASGTTNTDPFQTPATDSTTTTKKTDDTKPGDQTAGGKSDSPIQIVWLPNFCRQYSVTQKNFLSTSGLKLQLTNGWELDSVDASGDSTAVIGKLLDTVGGILGASSGKTSSSSKGGAQSTATAAAEPLYAKVTVKYLKPGLYPLISCTKDGYEKTSLTVPAANGTRIEWVKVIGD